MKISEDRLCRNLKTFRRAQKYVGKRGLATVIKTYPTEILVPLLRVQAARRRDCDAKGKKRKRCQCRELCHLITAAALRAVREKWACDPAALMCFGAVVPCQKHLDALRKHEPMTDDATFASWFDPSAYIP